MIGLQYSNYYFIVYKAMNLWLDPLSYFLCQLNKLDPENVNAQTIFFIIIILGLQSKTNAFMGKNSFGQFYEKQNLF